MKTILVFIDWYIPAYKAGGPIRSCINMIAHLKDDYIFKVICGPTDLHETKILTGIETGIWSKAPDQTDVLYINPLQLNYSFIKKVIADIKPDIVYLNSIYSLYYSIYPLISLKRSKKSIPIIIAPRGMLGTGSLAQKSLKKKLFLWFSKAIGLFSNVHWHCSTAQERHEVETVFGKNSSTFLAINLSEKKDIVFQSIEKHSGELRLVWLARISSVKNFKGAIEAVVKIKPMYKVVFDIFGPSDDAQYFQECVQMTKSAAPHLQFRFFEAVPHTEVHSLLSQYHFMFLPTFNENFGHGIIDSLMSACPVIISDRTPWNDLEKETAGFVGSIDEPISFTQLIEKACGMNQEEYNIFRKGAFDKAHKIMESSEGKNAHIQMFNQVLNEQR